MVDVSFYNPSDFDDPSFTLPIFPATGVIIMVLSSLLLYLTVLQSLSSNRSAHKVGISAHRRSLYLMGAAMFIRGWDLYKLLPYFIDRILQEVVSSMLMLNATFFTHQAFKASYQLMRRPLPPILRTVILYVIVPYVILDVVLILLECYLVQENTVDFCRNLLGVFFLISMATGQVMAASNLYKHVHGALNRIQFESDRKITLKLPRASHDRGRQLQAIQALQMSAWPQIPNANKPAEHDDRKQQTLPHNLNTANVNAGAGAAAAYVVNVNAHGNHAIIHVAAQQSKDKEEEKQQHQPQQQQQQRGFRQVNVNVLSEPDPTQTEMEDALSHTFLGSQTVEQSTLPKQTLQPTQLLVEPSEAAAQKDDAAKEIDTASGKEKENGSMTEEKTDGGDCIKGNDGENCAPTQSHSALSTIPALRLAPLGQHELPLRHQSPQLLKRSSHSTSHFSAPALLQYQQQQTQVQYRQQQHMTVSTLGSVSISASLSPHRPHHPPPIGSDTERQREREHEGSAIQSAVSATTSSASASNTTIGATATGTGTGSGGGSGVGSGVGSVGSISQPQRRFGSFVPSGSASASLQRSAGSIPSGPHSPSSGSGSTLTNGATAPHDFQPFASTHFQQPTHIYSSSSASSSTSSSSAKSFQKSSNNSAYLADASSSSASVPTASIVASAATSSGNSNGFGVSEIRSHPFALHSVAEQESIAEEAAVMENDDGSDDDDICWKQQKEREATATVSPHRSRRHRRTSGDAATTPVTGVVADSASSSGAAPLDSGSSSAVQPSSSSADSVIANRRRRVPNGRRPRRRPPQRRPRTDRRIEDDQHILPMHTLRPSRKQAALDAADAVVALQHQTAATAQAAVTDPRVSEPMSMLSSETAAIEMTFDRHAPPINAFAPMQVGAAATAAAANSAVLSTTVSITTTPGELQARLRSFLLATILFFTMTIVLSLALLLECYADYRNGFSGMSGFAPQKRDHLTYNPLFTTMAELAVTYVVAWYAWKQVKVNVEKGGSMEAFLKKGGLKALIVKKIILIIACGAKFQVEEDERVEEL